MDYSAMTTETLMFEYGRQEEMRDGFNRQLWGTDRPVDADWHELMGQRDGCQQILDELEEEINRRSIYKNKDGIFVHVAYDPEIQARLDSEE